MNPRPALALVVFFLMMPSVLKVQSAVPTSSPQWCTDAPASPPPPGFEHRRGDWTNVREMCGAHMGDRGCMRLCAFAEEL